MYVKPDKTKYLLKNINSPGASELSLGDLKSLGLLGVGNQ